MSFIYKIQNILNNKSYIGWTTKSVDFRWNEHKKDALKFRDNRKFYNAIRKYGINSWEVTTLCEVENKDDAVKKEIEFIIFYDSFNNGYNSTLGGDGNNGIIMSKESNLQRSKKLKGVKKPDGFNIGRVQTKETKNKISQSHIGKKKPWVKWSNEQIKKRSLTRRSLNKEQYDLMCKLRADGLITKEIAKIIGVSNDIIKKWIHKPW
jgi:group I intron endonuclease